MDRAPIKPAARPADDGESPRVITDLESEQATLGAVFVCPTEKQPELVRALLGIVVPADFVSDRCRLIWEAIRALASRGAPIDVLTVRTELVDTGRLDDAGGIAYLSNLDSYCPRSINATYYALRVARAARRRRIHLAAANVARAAVEEDDAELPGYLRDLEEATGESARPDASLACIDLTKLDAAEEPIPWRVQGWLGVPDVFLVAAEGGTGKSVLGMDLALALCTGTPFAGLIEIYGGPFRVLVFDQENPPRLVRHRLRLMCRGRGLDPSTLPLHYVVERGLSVDNGGTDRVVREIERFRPDVVLFDSLVRFHHYDENDNSQMSRLFNEFMGPVGQRYSCSIGSYHHLAKPSKERADAYHRVRGASELVNMVDSFWTLEGDRSTPNRTLRSEKCRWRGDLPKPISLAYQEDEDAGTAILRGEMEALIGESIVLRTIEIADRAGVLRADILSAATEQGVTEVQVKYILGRLHGLHYVKRAKEGKVSRYWLAHRAPEGAE